MDAPLQYQDLIGRLSPYDSGMAISPDTAAILASSLKECRPSVHVDLGTGSGASLLVALTNAPTTCHFITVDDDVRFLNSLKSLLGSVDLARVRFLHAPLILTSIAGRQQQWYHPQVLANVDTIDFLFIDGPVGAVGRFPALPFFLPRLTKTAVVMLDDCRRQDELSALHAWENILRQSGRAFERRMHMTDRGLAELRMQ